MNFYLPLSIGITIGIFIGLIIGAFVPEIVKMWENLRDRIIMKIMGF